MARQSFAFPNEQTIQGGLRGLSNVIHRLFLATSESVALEGILPNLAMIIPAGDFHRNENKETGQMGQFDFSIAEYNLAMSPHTLGMDRVISRGGDQGLIKVPVFPYQVTDSLDIWSLEPFAQEVLSTVQQAEFKFTVDFVARVINQVRLRDRAVPVLTKLHQPTGSANAFTTYDGESLISEDHKRLDGTTLFSNLYIPLAPIKHTELGDFPDRVNEDDPGLDELHRELSLMTVGMAQVRQSAVDHRQLNLDGQFTVLCRNPIIAKAFRDLAQVEVFNRAHIPAESEMMHLRNVFSGNVFDVWLTDSPALPSDFGYDIIPTRNNNVPLTALGAPVAPFQESAGGATGSTIQHQFGGIQVPAMIAEPMPVIWGLVMAQDVPQVKADLWKGMRVLISAMEMYGYAGGMPDRIARRAYVAPS